MQKRYWLFPILLLGLFVAVVMLINNGILFPKAVIDIDIVSALVIVFSVIIGYFAYVFSRRSDSRTLAENKRDAFINNPSFAHIRMLIERNDIEIQTIVMMLNIGGSYESETIPRGYWELQEEFDQYLNFLEGMAILYNHGDVFEESIEGLWAYYSIRLAQVDTMDRLSNTTKNDQIERCMKNIYGDHIPDRIQNAWQNALQGKGYDEVTDPITNKVIDPVKNPIWYYVCHECYSFTPLKMMVSKFSGQKAKTETAIEKPNLDKMAKVPWWSGLINILFMVLITVLSVGTILYLAGSYPLTSPSTNITLQSVGTLRTDNQSSNISLQTTGTLQSPGTSQNNGSPNFDLAVVAGILGGFAVTAAFIQKGPKHLQTNLIFQAGFYVLATLAFIVFGLYLGADKAGLLKNNTFLVNVYQVSFYVGLISLAVGMSFTLWSLLRLLFGNLKGFLALWEHAISGR